MMKSVEGKGKVHLRTYHEGPEREYKYSSITVTSAQAGGGWSMPFSGFFTTGKDTRYHHTGGWVWYQGPYIWVHKISPILGFSPVASHRTDYAFMAFKSVNVC